MEQEEEKTSVPADTDIANVKDDDDDDDSVLNNTNATTLLSVSTNEPQKEEEKKDNHEMMVDDDDDEKEEKEKEEITADEEKEELVDTANTGDVDVTKSDKLYRCVKKSFDLPRTELEPDVGEGEEIVGFLNCHIFEGTYVGRFYKKIVFEDQQRANAIIKYVMHSKAAVFMLAEVWSSSIRDRIIKGVSHVYPYSYYPKNGSFSKLDSGLVFLSKKAISHKDHKNYSKLTGWDRWSTKCAAYIITDDNIAYFTTHFNAGGNIDAKEARHSNILEMFAFYDKVVAEHGVTQAVITGDLNIRETDFAELQSVSDTERNPAIRAEWLKSRRPDYIDFRSRMEKRGLKDGLREAHPDHLEYPCITADHTYNSLAVLWTPKDVTRSRLDYFFVKGVVARESGGYFHWWAGKDADNPERQEDAFRSAAYGPKKDGVYPVSDHYGVWILFKK